MQGHGVLVLGQVANVDGFPCRDITKRQLTTGVSLEVSRFHDNGGWGLEGVGCAVSSHNGGKRERTGARSAEHLTARRGFPLEGSRLRHLERRVVVDGIVVLPRPIGI